jgi:G:T-mismatch repair DNA endonuclease (very short patch repair protein)
MDEKYRLLIICRYGRVWVVQHYLYDMTEEHKRKISEALKGKPHFYSRGKNNPNYGGKLINNPETKKKYLESVKIRGQGWNDVLIKQHADRMLGESNWMRGKHHSEETKQKIRNTILSGFASGKRTPNKTMVSKPEKDIAKLLTEMGHSIKMGVRIENNLYDILVIEKNLIIEFNGDYWHMNPLKYSSTSYNKACGMTAQEVWNRDKHKSEVAIKNGYKFRCIWENDYKKSNNKNDFLEKILIDEK